MPDPQRPPRLLYLAYFFPPSRASGVFRALATANYFAANGWDVTVLKAPDSFFEKVTGSVDHALTEAVDPRLEIADPPVDHFQWETDLREYGWFRGNFPVLAKRWHAWKQRRIFPDKYLSWGVSAFREGLRRHRREPFDLIVATGNPFAAFGSAWALGRVAKRPFVIDYRDAWTLNQFTDEDMFPPGHPAWKWERRITRAAAASLHVNDALREWHAGKYPEAADRMKVVLNGWDPDLMPEIATAGPADDRPLAYSFIGTLTPVQPIDAMIGGYQRMVAAGRHADSRLDLYGHVGFFSNSEAKLRSELGLDEPVDGVTYRGPVPKPQIATAYDASDVLLFMTGGGKYVTTGKVFEYMASGKPIVSIHDKGCAAEELLRDYPLWFEPASLDPADVAVAMADAGDAARKADPLTAEQARRYAETFTRSRQLEGFERWARDLVTERNRR